VAEGLQTLRRGLRRAEGFALFVAVCNQVPERDSLIQELADSLPGFEFRTVHLKEDTLDPLEEVLSQAGSPSPPPGPVMVVDFDKPLPSEVPYHPILQALNLRRPEWPRIIPHPVVFWVPDYVLSLLGREAPDFLDWRSLTVFFPNATDRDLLPIRSDVWDGDSLYTNQTHSERLARVEELRSRLAMYPEATTDAQIARMRAKWLAELGYHQLFLAQYRPAIDSFEHVLGLVRSNGDRGGEGQALRGLGNAHDALGDARTAIRFYEQALDIAHEVGDRRGEGNVLNSLGVAHRKLGDVRRAIEYYEQRLDIAREVGDRRGEGVGLRSLGIAHYALGDARAAIRFYEQALDIAREIGDRHGEGNALHWLGIAHDALGDARAAIRFYEQALDIAREIGDRRGEGAALRSLGIAHKNLGDPRTAIRFYEQQLDIAREIGDRRGEANASWNMALSREALGRQEAAEFAQRALAIYKAIEDPFTKSVERQLQAWGASTPPPPAK